MADILIVDDTPANLEVLADMLTAQGYNVRPAINGDLALRAVKKNPPDLILLDINMPGMSGYEVCIRLKEDPQSVNIPVIFISALSEVEDKIEAFRVGGVDYVTKPFRSEEVLARVQAQLTLYMQRREIEFLMEKQRQNFENLSHLKDDMVATASHDLKNPLGVIIGYASLIKSLDLSVEGDLAVQFAEEIERASARMNNLISNLLDLAKLETGLAMQLAEGELHGFLEKALADFRFSAEEKSIELLFEPFADEPVYMLYDDFRLSQVIHNLLSNAIKYTPAGGQVCLRTDVVKGGVVIMVSDSGYGIPPESLPRLFEKFYRVPDKQHMAVKGTGLGLAIVKAIIEQHQGQIEIESELGKGSTFIITLPLQGA